MLEREFYYTLQRYQEAGIQPFLDHTREYIAGERTIPACKVSSFAGEDITFTFSNRLLRDFLEDSKRMEKPYEVALKYGFRGYSSGEKNGIFYQHKDSRMRKNIERLMRRDVQQITKDIDISEEGLDALCRVKIVWHGPSGTRIVGVYAPEKARMFFMDFASY